MRERVLRGDIPAGIYSSRGLEAVLERAWVGDIAAGSYILSCLEEPLLERALRGERYQQEAIE